MRKNFHKIARNGLWLFVGLELTATCLQVSTSAVGLGTGVTIATFGLLSVGWIILILALVGGTRFRRPIWLGLLALLIGLVLLLWAGSQVMTTPGYGVDEAALDQWAAQLAWHGVNPYSHSLRAGLRFFSVPMSGLSFFRNGHLVTTLSYPALAFEVYWPFLWFGWTTQLPIILNVTLWIMTIVLLFRWLPRHGKPMALVVALFPLYLNYVISGFAVVIALPLVVWAARRIPDERRDLQKWYGSAALLGFAAAVNQWVWVLLPFVWAAHLVAPPDFATGARWRWSRLIKHAGTTVAAFALPNLPFLLRDFPAWCHGVLFPLIAPLAPGGQGWSAVVLSGIGSIGVWHQIIVYLLFVGMLVVYLAYANSWELLTFLLPSVVLFWSARSFSLYWMLGVIPSLALWASGRVHYPRRRELRSLGIVLIAFIGINLASSLLVPGLPARVQVAGWSQGGPDAYINNVSITIQNTGKHPLPQPTFFLRTPTGLAGLWHPVQATATPIPAGAARRLTLTTSHFAAMIPPQTPFRVVAVTANGSAKASVVAQPRIVHLVLETRKIGRQLTIRVFMRGRWNQPLHEAGSRIALSQVKATPSGTLPGTATINHAQPGQSPVVARTNQKGVATFRIHLPSTKQTLTFQADLVGQHGTLAYSSPVSTDP